MNSGYRYLIALLFGLVGVFAYRVLFGREEGNDSNPAKSRLFDLKYTALFVVHLSVLALWLLVPESPTLFFADWTGFSIALLLRGAAALTYAAFVPGVLGALLLDPKRHLSRLELLIFGYLSSIFIVSTLGYTLFTLNFDLNIYLLPLLWGFATALFGVCILSRRHQIGLKLQERPSSFPSRHTQYLMGSVTALLLVLIIAINVSWRVLLGGDLWTHAAQTAYLLQGQTSVNYPWVFHFYSAAIHAISGFPIVNAMQLLQFLAPMPVLALYVTSSALVGRNNPKIPAFSSLFFAMFMGLGWASYLWLSATTSPQGSSAVYGTEFIASELTYDILLGLFAYRIVLVPANIAVTALIYGIRLVGGFQLSSRHVAVGSFIVVAVMIQSHLFEAGFFTSILAASIIFLWDYNQKRTLIVTAASAAAGFAWAFVVDYYSPQANQLLTYSSGNFYFSGYEYALIPLVAGLLIIPIRSFIDMKRSNASDLIARIYVPLGANITRLEKPFLRVAIVACIALGIFFGLYTIVNQPFFGWQTADTGYVPWNYYPIRIGVVTLFAVLGAVALITRQEDFRRLFVFLSLAVISIFIGRFTGFLGLRPQGFGENRVMDFLWLGSVVPAAYGLSRLAPPLIDRLSSSQTKHLIMGAALICLLLLAGASSFFLFVDGYLENSATPGLIPNSADMAVINYIVTHRSSVGFTLTAPTFETLYIIRKLTLNPPYGYNIPFTTPPLFTSTTLSGFLTQTISYPEFRVFLTAHDASFLQNSGYLLSLWYLGFQPALVDAGSSFLIAPQMLEYPDGGSITALFEPQISQENFLLLSALGLSRTSYSMQTLGAVVGASNPEIVLGMDPTSNNTFQSALSWVRTSGGTLFVASNLNSPGLFEGKFFADQEGSSTFSAISVFGSLGGTTVYNVPVPFVVHQRQATNATVLSWYQGSAASSPMTYVRNFGTGRVILLMLRDYYQFLLGKTFTDAGRRSYTFLPYLAQAAGLPISP